MIEQRPPGPGRPRWWIGGAITLGVGLVLLAIGLLLTARAGEDPARTSTSAPATDATPATEANPLARPGFTGERVPLATDGGEGSAPATTDPTPNAGSSLARWTGATSTFTGRVIDHEGQPLPGASVTCWPSDATREALGIDRGALGPEIDPALSASTDGDGYFILRAPHVKRASGSSFDDFEDFPWLLVQAEGYAVRSVRCTGLLSGDYDAGTIAVEPGGYLTGRAVDEHGQPVAGARLLARHSRYEPRRVATEDDWEAMFTEHAVSDVSGEDGRFELGAFWPGSVEIRITADGYLFSIHEDVPIEVGARHDLGDVILPGGATLRGVIVDSAAAPVPDAFVAVKPSYQQIAAEEHDNVLRHTEWLRTTDAPQAQTDSEGSFTLTGLEPANYSLFVDAAGFEPLRVRNVSVGSEELQLTLVRQATLLLIVLDEETRTPIDDASVEAVRRAGDQNPRLDPRLPVRAGTGRGEFIVERIGTWRTDLLVSAPGYAAIGSSVEAATPPESLRHTVSLSREARVTGHVRGSAGQPLAVSRVITVTLKDAPVEQPAHSAASDAEGMYEISGLPPGEWVLCGSAEGFADVERTVAVPASGVVIDIDFQLEPTATIFGTCFASDGRPVPGHIVVLTRVADDGPKAWIEVSSNVQGDFRAANLQPGRWVVMNWQRAEVEVEVDIAPGQELRVDLHQRKRPVIRGHVLAVGQPRTGVMVMVLDRRREKQLGFAATRWTTKADAEGAYELEVDAGEFYLQAAGVDPPCGGSAAVPLTVDWGEQRVVDLVFSGERVAFLVVDAASGNPLPGAAVVLKRASASDPLTPTFNFGNKGDRTEFWPRSNAEGRAELPFVLPGSYLVQCELEGFVPPQLPELVVTAGMPRELRIELVAEAVLSGSAKLASGAPIREFTLITLKRAGSPDTYQDLTPTRNGRFKFSKLAAGEYILAIWKDYPPEPDQPAIAPPLLELPITLKPGESRTVELQLPP